MAKYAEQRYVVRSEDADPFRLHDAVKSRDLTSLLQLYAEGADLSRALALPEGHVSAKENQLCGNKNHEKIHVCREKQVLTVFPSMC